MTVDEVVNLKIGDIIKINDYKTSTFYVVISWNMTGVGHVKEVNLIRIRFRWILPFRFIKTVQDKDLYDKYEKVDTWAV